MAPLSLAEAIAARIVGDVDASVRARAEYSTDASNYRVPPQVVVFPKNDDDVAAVLEICRERGVALTSLNAVSTGPPRATGRLAGWQRPDPPRRPTQNMNIASTRPVYESVAGMFKRTVDRLLPGSPNFQKNCRNAESERPAG
ncbi:hypothetical protein X956_08680 [Trueperella pyogenes TP8]|uniref:FAD-binding oxidoreductase n=1 Tax=Trueperella pyogenes TaxID=1661 RepID=UPI00058033EF|nr:FAD-binding oxidoreductase [Trueperella pyogenes]AJC70686.1 hypothetical protein X956_08680 [Trueperella pyogenes TP8]